MSTLGTMALVPHEYAISRMRFTGGFASGPAVGVVSAALLSPLVSEVSQIFTIPFYRYGPAAQIGETFGHIAVPFGPHLIEIIARQIQVDGVTRFLFLIRSGLTGPRTFQETIYNPHGTRPSGEEEGFENQIVRRRVKNGWDFNLYLYSYGDGETGEVVSYMEPDEVSGDEVVFLLEGITDDQDLAEAVFW
ncbi:hypothetical protein MMC11_007108 [Xylographa trunciseda]|nr:hypothetical protein [Xylographa trunciseda]